MIRAYNWQNCQKAKKEEGNEWEKIRKPAFCQIFVVQRKVPVYNTCVSDVGLMQNSGGKSAGDKKEK